MKNIKTTLVHNSALTVMQYDLDLRYQYITLSLSLKWIPPKLATFMTHSDISILVDTVDTLQPSVD